MTQQTTRQVTVVDEDRSMVHGDVKSIMLFVALGRTRSGHPNCSRFLAEGCVLKRSVVLLQY